ncbi:MAG: transcription-repair coupling factor [Parachlamydiaceae bacterium]|nr:transcription-repair coupling factor [Parachlamydiaceae bacterium]
MLQELLKNERLHALQHALHEQQSIVIEDLWNAPKALIIALAQQTTGKHILILTGASQEELRLYHDFPFFSERPVINFPAWETLPSDQVPPSPDIVGDRYKVLHEIATSNEPFIILSSLQACLQHIIAPNIFKDLYLTLKVGDNIPFEQLVQRLIDMGYQRQSVASDKGEFAVRGGIIDVFPVSTPDPYRIEFWGDDIESMRTYDPIGQKSIQPANHIDIPPAKELELLKQSSSKHTILDYLGSQTLVILDDLLALEDRYATLMSMGGTPSAAFSSIGELFDQLAPLQKIFLSQQPIEELSDLRLLEKSKENFYSSQSLHFIAFQMFDRELQARRWQHPFVPVASYLLPEIPENQEISGSDVFSALKKLESSDYHLHILCATESDEVGFRDKLAANEITVPTQTTFHLGYLSSGLVMADPKIILLPLTEITHRYKIRRQKQRSTYHTVQSEFFDLAPGEMIVHLDHGIGRFLGLEKRPNHQGIPTEFFQLEYADQAKLFVPINQAHQLSKYIGAGEAEPKMHTIGGTRWKRTRENTERAIIGYAQDLLHLYASRSVKEGFSYPEDGADMQAFEEDFPYVETEDQLEAISAIKGDMHSGNSMDRLVCGDVGYGKTEVAMRAAFKAVVDGHKQVAVLVPTTVLAMQHYENFQERMRNFPINIGVLSRFRTAKETRKTLEDAAEGKIDILIGTHRIISDDVKFKDLGLVIIDEEQRFGVRAKEHLKKIKLNVDCLTLSATPIPRTLYMSLVGVRDMSVISTPPQDRLPITTIITEPNEQVLKNALLRELARDGQAFVIHNRVETIYEAADHIKKLLPQARVVVGHGQMHADESDQVFHAFKNGQADILVATTIVENGIDIPNANTILIERADHFGMADLYQLRGRVGRWNRSAFAYFLVRNLQRMPELSRKRLQALAESSGYGGGMKVAMRDLEIRGAGNILGTEQSGHVAAIGFHLYCKMLKRTVKAFRGELPKNLTDTKMEFPFDARLPEDYVNEVSLRMEIYQRLGEVLELDAVDSLWEEVIDRFGPPPEPAQWLYYFTRVRVFASLNGFTLLKLEKVSLVAERREAKQMNTRRMLIKKITSPSELEEKIIPLLQKEFRLN